jgi:hypothetical protein
VDARKPNDHPPVEALARRLCKLLQARGALSRDDLAQAAEVSQRSALSLRARRRLEQQDGEFSKALELSVARGWVESAGSLLRLTAMGASFALRSRSGTRKRRQIV